MGSGQLQGFLDGLASLGGATSALEAIVADGGQTLFRHAAGFRVGGEPLAAASGARFDVASLTKPWMATLAMLLDRDSTLPLATPIGDLAGGACAAAARTTLEELLRHRSGIPPWTPLWVQTGGRLDRLAVESLLLTEGLWERRGDTPAYSDLGYVLWGLLAESATGRALPELLDARVASPLGLPAIGTLAAEPPFPVECRLDNGREVELAREEGIEIVRQAPFLLGRPQDGNARRLSYLGAHAGLFLTADELLALGREWLAPGRLLVAAEVERALAGEGEYALGWARQSAGGSSGPALSPGAFGHTGFTGGSLWIERAAGRIHLLLAHRLSSRQEFNGIRREFHRLAAAL